MIVATTIFERLFLILLAQKLRFVLSNFVKLAESFRKGSTTPPMFYNLPKCPTIPQCPALMLYNTYIPANCRLCSITRSFSDSSVLVRLPWVVCVVCSFLCTDVSADVVDVVSLLVWFVVCTGPRRAAWLKNALDVSHVSSYMTKYSVSAAERICGAKHMIIYIAL